MYKQKNGILYIDGEPKIMLGASYYPSFHNKKYPVPPTADRLGEMKRDVAAMAEFGLNQVRLAALGDINLDGEDNVGFCGEFIDSAVEEIARAGMTSSLRIQGYVINIRGNTSFLMRNHKDEEMDGVWSAFITASLFHEGINRDTNDATRVIASHYAKMPGVLSLQTYNEPHYPYNGIFDYHPDTLAAYKEWLSSNNLEIKDPPRKRPEAGEDKEDWISWRIFSMRAMSNFLNSAAKIAKDASGLEGYTCATASPSSMKMMDGGTSYFDIAEGMDIVGITNYIHCEGADYFAFCYVNDLAESAAATFGKHAWTVEADARVNMPGRKVKEAVYSILGSAHKGINFYEWRGDYSDEGTPLPDNCGIIHNDGRKAQHYNDTKAMVDFVNRYSRLFADAEKHRDGIGILYSERAFAYADAEYRDNNNAAINDVLAVYREARKLGFCVDITRAEDLEKNPLSVKLLVVPYELSMLSDEEMGAVNAFAEKGNKVYVKRTAATFSAYAYGGLWPLGKEIKNATTHHFEANYELEDAVQEAEISPFVKCSDRSIQTSVLDGDTYKLVTLVNISVKHKKASGAYLTISDSPREAKLLIPEGEYPLSINSGKILLPDIDAGGVVYLSY